MPGSIERRIRALEARFPRTDPEDDAVRAMLGKLSDTELEELESHLSALVEGREAAPLSFDLEEKFSTQVLGG